MTIEQKLKEKIIGEYGTLKNFVEKTDLKYSTVDSILKRGIMNSNIQNVLTICSVLNLSADELAQGKLVPLDATKRDKDEQIELVKIAQTYKFKLTGKINMTLDGEKLSKQEAQFIIDAMEIAIEHIRKKRKRDGKQ